MTVVSDIILDESWTNISELKERDIDVIQVIQIEDLAYFTFIGLKRRLKIHPETLSRILTRLTQDGILKKTNKGYSLTTKGKHLLNQQNQGGLLQQEYLHFNHLFLLTFQSTKLSLT